MTTSQRDYSLKPFFKLLGTGLKYLACLLNLDLDLDESKSQRAIASNWKLDPQMSDIHGFGLVKCGV